MDVVDLEQIRQQLASGLPKSARWIVHRTPIAFTFWTEKLPRQLEPSDFRNTWEPTWSKLLLFGEANHADGGGARPYLCVHEDTGRVYDLDVEDDLDSVCLYNSDVERFISCFTLFDRVIRQGEESLDQLAAMAASADPEAFPTTHWRKLLEYLRAGSVSPEI